MSRKIRSLIPLALSLVCTFVLTLTTTYAQVTTADIVGTVTDQSGATLVTGTATVTNTGTGVSQKVTLNSNGGFEFTLLQLGTYNVTVQAQGFKSFVTQVTLAAGDRTRVNAQLSVGQADQTITVESTTPALQTDESTVGTLITSQATQDLPLNGRNVLNLITLSAGVTGGLSNAMNSGTRPDDRRQGSNFAANGQSDENNNNMVDGMDNNERFIGSVGVKPAIDAIDQVRVLTNLYSAEVSRSGGGIVDLITKSGNNQFHGTLYEFLRNDKLDAKDYFATTGPKPELRQNQFGGSVGGPIKRDKTFFFFDYEGYRLVKGVTNNSTVPTLFEEQNPGNFSDLGAGCTNLTATPGWTPGTIGLNYFKLYPAPNRAVAIPGSNCAAPQNNYSFNGGQTQYTTTYDGRADQRFSAKDSMFGRYTYNNANVYIPGNYPLVKYGDATINPGAGPYGNFSGPAIDQDQSIALGYTHLITINTILDLRAQYMRLNHDSNPVNVGIDAATIFGFPCDATGCVNGAGDVAESGLPNLNFAHGYGALGDADYVPLLNQNNSFEYAGAISWLRGVHSFKFGGSAIRRQGSLGQSAHPRGQLQITGLVTGNDLADMLQDYASSITRVETIVPPAFRASEFAGYVKDDWRVRPKITLNLGVRWDLYTPFTAQNGAKNNWSVPLGVIVGPNLLGVQHSSPTGGVTRDYTDFAPRIGVAYSLRADLVIHAGYGIGYYPGNDANGAVAGNAPYQFSYGCGNTTYTTAGPCAGQFTNSALDPNGGYYMDGSMPIPVVDLLNATDPTRYAGTTIFGTVPDYRNPFLQQYSVNVEKDFKGNVATIAYVGNHGNRLVLNGTNQNQLPYPIAEGGQFPYHNLIPATCDQYADCAAIGAGVLDTVGVQMRDTVMRSNYNALQATLQRRYKSGFAANVNYTYARNLTNAQVIDEGQGVGNCVGPCHVDDGHGKAVTYNSYFQYDYGNADLDTRHSFSLTASYELPFGKGLNGPMGIVAKGWSVNSIYYAHTGNPFTVSNDSGAQSGIGLGSDRPNSVNSSQTGFHKGVLQWFDVTRFQRQGAGLQGNEERNQVYGPGTQALGFSLFKTFPIHENIRLQFRAESFNLLNTPTFANPNSTINAYDANGVAVPNVGVGEITGTVPSASPRQLQFALKLIF
jgi:carboxypeptidase family protein